MSTLCYRTPLREDRPPWQVIVVNGVGDDCERTTWVILRTHQLLESASILPQVAVNAYLDPWIGSNDQPLPLFSAPLASRQFCIMLSKEIFPLFKVIWNVVSRLLLIMFAEILDLISEVAPQFYKKISDECHNVFAEKHLFFFLLMALDIIIRFPSILVSGFLEMKKYIKRSEGHKLLERFIFVIISRIIRETIVFCIVLGLVALRILIDTYRIVCWISRVRKIRTPREKICFRAALEVYWIVRAAVSLPRLILEELFETKRASPLEIWTNQKKLSHMKITWSEGVPKKLVRGIQNVTGASLPTVLLTATTGAVRSHLKASGIKVPKIIRCTLPVCTSVGNCISSPTLLPLTLPTGELNATDALEQVRKSLQNIRGYPEKYLVSSWFLKHCAFLLPCSTLVNISRKLSGHCPILLSYITAPDEHLCLWGHEVTGVIHLRQPVHDAGKILIILSKSIKNKCQCIYRYWVCLSLSVHRQSIRGF